MSLTTALILAGLCGLLLIAGPWLTLAWPMRCLFLPWHTFTSRWRLTEQSEKVVCSCGRAYGINHAMEIVLPWDSVKELYEGPGSILRPTPGRPS